MRFLRARHPQPAVDSALPCPARRTQYAQVRTSPVGTVTFSFIQLFRRLLRGLPWHVAASERRVLRMRE